MLDLSNSVILPREDFLELTMSAFDQDPASLGTRVASTVQILTICFGMAASVAVGTWAWTKQLEKLEDKKLATWRAQREAKTAVPPTK